MHWALILLTVAAGTFRSMQAGSNGKLGEKLEQPLFSGIMVLLLGLASFAVVIPFVGLHWPGTDKLRSVPWWGWLGGSFGVVYVAASTLASEKLGAAVFNGIVVAAMMVTAVALDHFGWMGFEVRSATPLRLGGTALMLIGFAMITKF